MKHINIISFIILISQPVVPNLFKQRSVFFLSYSLKNINMIFKISSMNFLLLYPELRNN